MHRARSIIVHTVRSVPLGALLFFTDFGLAFASAQDLGGAMQHIGSQGTSIAQGIKIVIMVIGLALAGFGLFSFITAGKQGRGHGSALAMIIIGALMISIPAVIMLTSGTLLGSGNGASSSMGQLGIGG